ncbi:uncharacterized protein UV8b_08230 [Ustilaginoidea virens]|uniref:Uncharacterized protein n=1 Tax=Ustilaginoidea virens TaxID=1159556 RepID=A0A063C5N5_USTVR|nr:uncharacterized protein UV8b_08230 [Ustilaginoidea virens]QUC23989.1 hypothetical protein UV8b_08230 [Ustilaginoidea virens]GAO16255.1 hypothetical protein UVI_02000360 [Ustilaginoidea virens]
MEEFPQENPSADGLGHLRPTSTGRLLDLIEQVRAKGVGDVVSLPQLVVCGDQSAGKSSVLEGITGMPFPRKDGLCTRFPTEIIMRHARASDTSIVASIRPSNSSTPGIHQTLAAYRRQMEGMAELPDVINKVSRLMNIRGYGDKGSRAFAADSLRIEITGATRLHLSVVDLPGLIAVSNEEQTQDDVEAVHDMVASYLRNPRSIILAVLQANNDMANQPIIKLARQHDPQGERTVGIITKPDLINKGSEAKLALIAKNQDSIKLKLGFFLVKNPSPQEMSEGLTKDARSARELRFFSSAEWARQGLDMDRVGIANLRAFLQKLLDTHIERELPNVRDEIKKALKDGTDQLKDLGDARSSIGHIRSFMTDISMKFCQLLQAALDGSYHSIDARFFDNPDSRLRARIQETNTNFAAHMQQYGQKRKVSDSAEGESVNSTKSSDSSGQNRTGDQPAQLTVSKKSMMAWVKKVYLSTRGRELPGNNNPAFLAELFLEQSRLWPGLAEHHICNVLGIVSGWMPVALRKTISEDSVRGHVHAILTEWRDTTEKLALGELERLVEDERRDPLTYNHYYTDNVQKARLNSQKEAIRNAVSHAIAVDHRGKLLIGNTREDLEGLISSMESRITLDMDEQACNEAATQLDAYYNVALKTFIDNVTRQVVERQIMAPFRDAFSPKAISQLSDEELLRIGSEPEEQTRKREQLSKMVQGLKDSLKQLDRL